MTTRGDRVPDNDQGRKRDPFVLKNGRRSYPRGTSTDPEKLPFHECLKAQTWRLGLKPSPYRVFLHECGRYPEHGGIRPPAEAVGLDLPPRTAAPADEQPAPPSADTPAPPVKSEAEPQAGRPSLEEKHPVRGADEEPGGASPVQDLKTPTRSRGR